MNAAAFEITGAEFSLRKSEARTRPAPIIKARPRPARRSRLENRKLSES